MRATFLNRKSLTVASESECLIYGPESAKAYAAVRASHEAILHDRELATVALGGFRRVLRNYAGMSLREQNLALATVFPVEWERLCPWHRLSRTGFTVMCDAARRDTESFQTLPDTSDGSAENSALKICRSPREAYERYGKDAA